MSGSIPGEVDLPISGAGLRQREEKRPAAGTATKNQYGRTTYLRRSTYVATPYITAPQPYRAACSPGTFAPATITRSRDSFAPTPYRILNLHPPTFTDHLHLYIHVRIIRTCRPTRVCRWRKNTFSGQTTAGSQIVRLNWTFVHVVTAHFSTPDHINFAKF